MNWESSSWLYLLVKGNSPLAGGDRDKFVYFGGAKIRPKFI